MHKCALAQSNFMAELVTCLQTNPAEPCALLLQEPYHWQGLKAPQGFTCHFNDKAPRAYIIVSSSLKAVTIDSLTTKDTCAVQVTSGKETLILISTYLDYNHPEVIYDFDKCINYALSKNMPFVLGMDSNAHSQMWGCPDSNTRGVKLEEFFCQKGLSLHNQGTTPTFSCSRGNSIIDLTLTDMSLNDRINDWKVHMEDYFSDHRLISFQLQVNKPDKMFFRSYSKTDWKLFAGFLSKSHWEIPKYWTKPILEEECYAFTTKLQEALEKFCPMKPVPSKKKPPPWWIPDLVNLKSKVRKAYKAYRNNSQSEEALSNYKKLRQEYICAIKKAKKASWHKFISEVDIYLLNKILKSKDSKKVSLMQHGNSILDADESLELLMETHFPSCVRPELPKLCPDDVFCTLQELQKLNFPSMVQLQEALKDFKPFKASGPDGIKPMVLHHLPQNFLERLLLIYKACIQLGYTPDSWCQAKAVFIPKPNKPSYDTPKSLRPITLSNYLIKGLEKLIKWKLEETSLQENPLHVNQHAFTKGKGTDTALLQVVDNIQRGLQRNQFTLGVFLDIAGAFDNINQLKALEAMKNKGFPGPETEWYASYITQRSATAEFCGKFVTRSLKKGTPQGGIISPLCWNIPFDELLSEFNKGPIKAIGYADDLSLLIVGQDPATLTDLMQQGIDKAVQWGQKYGLEFSAEKSIAVMFTTKRNWVKHDLVIKDTALPFKESVKYLGITLDSKLTWTEHVNNKLGKAKRHLMAFHKAISSKFGPSPILIKRAFTNIVLPAFAHGCHIWGDKCQQEGTIKRLEKLNRLAALLMAPMAPSTPTKGLEVMLDLIPVHLAIEQRATAIMARMRTQVIPSWDGIGHRNKRSLIFRWDKASPDLTKNIINTDRLPVRFMWNKNFKVHPPDKVRRKANEHNGINSYTDGSFINEKAGFGIHTLKGKETIYNGSFYLGKNNTIFQAEIAAIRKSADWLSQKGYKNQVITFHSDSQASLAAIANPAVNSSSVAGCITALNALGEHNKVHLRWVKAHIGTPGNERADLLAKRGANSGEGTSQEVPAAHATLGRTIKKNFYKKWQSQWDKHKECRQTKIWFPTLDTSKSNELLRLSRTDLGLHIQFLSGHNRLKRHMSLQDKNIDPTCRLCNEEEETSLHIYAECPVLQQQRWNIFHLIPPPPIPPKWSPNQVGRFLKEPHVANLFHWE